MGIKRYLKTHRSRELVLWATIFGGIVEWYEIFLFIHWKDLFSKLFFAHSPELALYNTLFIFFVGFLGRPVGALVFGDLGDRFGRKTAFIGSIALIVLPSILIGLIGLWIPAEGISVAIALCVLRFIQGMAAGAELPGAMCYLVESAQENKRIYFCSFAFLGPQIGVIISQIECYIIETQFSQEFIEMYAWRVSFILGGIIALIGLFFRRMLEESREFENLKAHHMISHAPVLDTLFRHPKEAMFGFFGSLLAVVGFYMMSIFLEICSQSFLSTSHSQKLLVSIAIMVLSTATLTLIGRVCNNYRTSSTLIFSAVGTLFFSVALYFVNSVGALAIIAVLLVLCLNMQFAILPCFVAELFPTAVRYTGIAFSFSLCDSIIGGAIPWVSNTMTGNLGVPMTFSLSMVVAAIISLIAFWLVRKNHIRRRERI